MGWGGLGRVPLTSVPHPTGEPGLPSAGGHQQEDAGAVSAHIRRCAAADLHAHAPGLVPSLPQLPGLPHPAAPGVPAVLFRGLGSTMAQELHPLVGRLRAHTSGPHMAGPTSPPLEADQAQGEVPHPWLHPSPACCCPGLSLVGSKRPSYLSCLHCRTRPRTRFK